MAEVFRIGVVGYSARGFDEAKALILLKTAYDTIEHEFPSSTKVVVSGLTDVGIPAVAYREAVQRGWRTVGIASAKAMEYRLFPVDERIIVGNEWGDESPTFLQSIDVLVRIGGGIQSLAESYQMKQSGKPVFEYDLPERGGA